MKQKTILLMRICQLNYFDASHISKVAVVALLRGIQRSLQVLKIQALVAVNEPLRDYQMFVMIMHSSQKMIAYQNWVHFEPLQSELSYSFVVINFIRQYLICKQNWLAIVASSTNQYYYFQVQSSLNNLTILTQTNYVLNLKFGNSKIHYQNHLFIKTNFTFAATWLHPKLVTHQTHQQEKKPVTIIIIAIVKFKYPSLIVLETKQLVQKNLNDLENHPFKTIKELVESSKLKFNFSSNCFN